MYNIVYSTLYYYFI